MKYGKRMEWSEQQIKQSVFEVINKLQLDRMPTRSEIEEYFGDSALTNKLSKGGGFRHYADLYNLEVKDSNSEFGKKYEQIIHDLLIEKGHDAEYTTTKFPYDLLVNKRIKIDVKAGRLAQAGNAVYYTFNLEKPRQTCDVYVVVTLDTKESIGKIYIIPASVLSGKTQLSIGANASRYDKYLDRWDLIEAIDNAFENIEKI